MLFFVFFSMVLHNLRTAEGPSILFLEKKMTWGASEISRGALVCTEGKWISLIYMCILRCLESKNDFCGLWLFLILFLSPELLYCVSLLPLSVLLLSLCLQLYIVSCISVSVFLYSVSSLSFPSICISSRWLLTWLFCQSIQKELWNPLLFRLCVWVWMDLNSVR